jgi:hypothetical protein
MGVKFVAIYLRIFFHEGSKNNIPLINHGKTNRQSKNCRTQERHANTEKDDGSGPHRYRRAEEKG